MIPLAECLAQTSEVHAIDLPGFGRSKGPLPAPSIPELADMLVRWLTIAKIERCHLVANSLGCQVCADLAARFADRVATLTLIGPTIDPAAHSISKHIPRLAADLVREPPRLFLNQIIDVLRAGPRRCFTMVREMFRDRIADKLPQIGVRSLVIRGEHDAIVPEAWAREAAQLLPRASHLTLRTAAHCVHYSHPAETARAILDFTRAAEDGR
jgi:2-hydroxy-6-oxonona-2,4-dienedioate hydrolase